MRLVVLVVALLLFAQNSSCGDHWETAAVGEPVAFGAVQLGQVLRDRRQSSTISATEGWWATSRQVDPSSTFAITSATHARDSGVGSTRPTVPRASERLN